MPLVGGGRNSTDLVYAKRLAESQEQVLDHREPVRPVSIQTGCRAVNKIRWFTANQIRVVKRYIGPNEHEYWGTSGYPEAARPF